MGDEKWAIHNNVEQTKMNHHQPHRRPFSSKKGDAVCMAVLEWNPVL